MKYLLLKIWFMVTITLALGTLIVRLVWQIVEIPSAGTLTIMIPLILAILGIYALLIYFTIKPNLKKLKSLPIGIGVTVTATAGLISSIIHFIRFVPSPEAEPPLSLIIAVLLLLAAISGYFLLLWVIWFFWKAGRS